MCLSCHRNVNNGLKQNKRGKRSGLTEVRVMTVGYLAPQLYSSDSNLLSPKPKKAALNMQLAAGFWFHP